MSPIKGLPSAPSYRNSLRLASVGTPIKAFAPKRTLRGRAGRHPPPSQVQVLHARTAHKYAYLSPKGQRNVQKPIPRCPDRAGRRGPLARRARAPPRPPHEDICQTRLRRQLGLLCRDCRRDSLPGAPPAARERAVRFKQIPKAPPVR